MISDEYKAIMKLNDTIKALNENILDCAKSLRKLADAGEKKDSDYWRPVFGNDAELPFPKYDWVLVKIRDDPKALKGAKCNVVHDLPHIAVFRHDGKWWPLEWEAPYGSEEVPFEVVYWKPIPGDSELHLYDELGNIIDRGHTYE